MEERRSSLEEVQGRRKVKNSAGGGESSNLVGIICSPVEIGLTDLPKFGGAMASLAPSVPTGLKFTSFS